MSDIKQEVIDALKTLPVYNPNNSGTQHVVRCEKCGDSRNQSHGHFSIHIDVDSNTPMMYRCFKCDAKGLLTAEDLEEMGLCLSSDTQKSLNKFNVKMSKVYRFTDIPNAKYTVPKYQSNRLNELKREYLCSRLGYDMTYQEMQESKIVLNMEEFMHHNELTSISDVNAKRIKFTDWNYIGFLSTNNNCITFRRINERQEIRRYDKIIINPKNINPNTFYSCPSSIDLLYTHQLNVHVAEGIFDTLSIRYNVTKPTPNDLYYAACGFGYSSVIKYLIKMGVNTGIHLHVYSDNDKSDKDHFRWLFYDKHSLSSWIDRISIHRNQYQGEKDYGVPIKRIMDTHRIIK